MKRIAQIEKSYKKENIPDFKPGDTVKVHVKIKEGDKERIQIFQGTVISRRGGGTGETFTVRKISAGVGIERIFPLCSPNIDKIERTRMGKVRRSKLYYLRGLTGKSARIEEKLDEKALAIMKGEKEKRRAAKKTANDEAPDIDTAADDTAPIEVEENVEEAVKDTKKDTASAKAKAKKSTKKAKKESDKKKK